MPRDAGERERAGVPPRRGNDSRVLRSLQEVGRQEATGLRSRRECDDESGSARRRAGAFATPILALKRKRPVAFYYWARAGCLAPMIRSSSKSRPSIRRSGKTSRRATHRSRRRPIRRAARSSAPMSNWQGAAARRLPQERHHQQRADLEDAGRGPREGASRRSSRRSSSSRPSRMSGRHGCRPMSPPRSRPA